MVGDKYVGIGGGTLQWTKSSINLIIDAINNNQFVRYQGLCFDIEAGDVGLADDLERMYTATKNKNLKVMTTISHSAPFAFPDAKVVVEGMFNSNNNDYISPQMYTFDFGTTNEYDPNNAVSWIEFSNYYINRRNANLKIIPSIFSGVDLNGTYNLYNTGGTNNGLKPINFNDPLYEIDTGVKDFFSAYNIDAGGYTQWINGTLSKI